VIVDSEGVWDRVRRELAAAHGRPWPETATLDMMGMSAPEWSAYMAERVGVPLPPSRIDAEVVAGIGAAYRERLPLIEGALPAVRRLGRRFPLGLASSSNRAVIDSVLAEAGIADAFQVTVSSEEVPRGKPSPDVYAAALASLGAAPGRAVAIEDSSNGVRAAHAAGMAVVCIPRAAHPPAPDALGLAAAVVPSAAHLWPSLARRVITDRG
jgi:HAD superfamily hydrolase (TIGR01509 family)